MFWASVQRRIGQVISKGTSSWEAKKSGKQRRDRNEGAVVARGAQGGGRREQSRAESRIYILSHSTSLTLNLGSTYPCSR